MSNFFDDAPWCNIPPERQGEILIEPLYPLGRLMGGSSFQGDAKVSKLAALAAARRKKENTRSTSGTVTSSVALLDKLGGKMSLDSPSKLAVTPDAATARALNHLQADNPKTVKKYPVRERDVLNSRIAKDAIPPGDCILSETKRDPEPLSIPIALPSAFARTILGQTFERGTTSGQNDSSCDLVRSPDRFSFHIADAKMDIFAEPSPDDVVLKAQTSKGLLQDASRV